MKLSVIVPVYNAAPFLPRCLDSLLLQWPNTEDGYEIICVNDGSTDNSRQIILDYQQSYPSIIKLIEQSNQGLPSARNRGMSYAEGEIIAFCDADDFLVAGAYYFLYTNFWDKSIDLLRFFSITLDRFVDEKEFDMKRLTGNVVREGIGSEFLDDLSILTSVWSSFYRRSFLDMHSISTSPVSIAEDVLFNLDVLMQQPRVRMVDSRVYCYTVSANQITRQRERNVMRKYIDGYIFVFERINKYAYTLPILSFELERHKRKHYISCFSRVLSADYSHNEYSCFKSKIIQLGLSPLKQSSKYDIFINVMNQNYYSYKLFSFFYRHFFIPYILPRLSRN